jgi:hypothetical protein
MVKIYADGGSNDNMYIKYTRSVYTYKIRNLIATKYNRHITVSLPALIADSVIERESLGDCSLLSCDP